MEENTSEVRPPENISISDAMTGVIAEPAPTFDEVKTSTKRSYWVVPIIIYAVVTVISTFLVMNDEELYSEIQEKQRETIKSQLEEAVAEGKMTKEKMEEVMEQSEKTFGKSSPLFYVLTTLGPISTIFVSLFFRGLIFWGAIKLLKGTASYMLVICVLGLTSVIDSIQSVVDTALAIFMGKLNANIGPALLFSVEAVGEKMNVFLAHFDVFNIWYLLVIGIGLAKVSGLRNIQTMPIVFGLWLIWIAATTFLGLPFVS